MGVQDLQLFLESGQIEGSCVGVDLVRIARTQTQKLKQSQNNKKTANGPAKFSLVIDAECCLDRLYGGYFSDWVCGGQWNRVTTFLGQFVSSLNASQIKLAVFFNGCVEQERTNEWIAEQLLIRAKITQVLRHLVNKGTPPPKVWWTPPSCLKPTLRLVLRNLNIPVYVSMDDHKQEVIAYCRENGCHAIVADDAEYIAFNPPRYFSARHLKLTYKGTLESKEYIISELTKALKLTNEQLCILAALMGNFLLPEAELSDLYKKLMLPLPVRSKDGTGGEGQAVKAVSAVAAFVHSLQSKQLEHLGREIFGAVGGERAAKFKRAVQYYSDGTKIGLSRVGTNSHGKKSNRKPKHGEGASPSDHSTFASEASGNELAGLVSSSEAFACLNVSDKEAENGDFDPGFDVDNNSTTNSSFLAATDDSSPVSPARSPSCAAPQPSEAASAPAPAAAAPPKQKKHVRLVVEADKVFVPNVTSGIMRTVSERHAKGLMSPLIYQVLTQGEVKLPVVMEDDSFKDISGIQQFYGPLRAMLYAILFNLNHQAYMARQTTKPHEDSYHRTESALPEIKVKEWIWSKENPYERPEIVTAQPLGWGVPTIQRLWFGTTLDDKKRRLRTYLTVMRSDTHLMLNPSCVPQHLLILASVLRYIMSCPSRRILRKHELDAIIAMAFDPNLSNCYVNQELQVQVDCVTSRGVQLGAMIMTGIEYALVVNDACGAPIPWLMTWPWLCFDGKLLHLTLTRAATVKNLLELCEYRIPQVMKVESMREAVLEGIFVEWARPNFPVQPTVARPFRGDDSRQPLPPGTSPRMFRGPAQAPSRGRDSFPEPIIGCRCVHDVGEGYRYVVTLTSALQMRMTTGGRLEIAGVVVGNWGPNCRLHSTNLMMSPPQVTSVGGVGSYESYGARGGKASEHRFNGSGLHQNRLLQAAGKPALSKKKYIVGFNKKDAGRKPSRGRGLTVLTPLAGENVVTPTVLSQETVHEEKKRILTNSVAKSPPNKPGPVQLVNGQSSEAEALPTVLTDRFDDNPCELAGLLSGVIINGDCLTTAAASALPSN